MRADDNLSSSSPTPSVTSPLFASVVIDRGQSSVDMELTYLVPESLREALRIGTAILVPLGRQRITGYITGFSNETSFDVARLKPIQQLISKAPLFDAKALKVARWLSAYCHCPLSDCIGCFVPHGWQLGAQRRYAITSAGRDRKDTGTPREKALLNALADSTRPLTKQEIATLLNQPKERIPAVADALNKLEAGELVEVSEELLDPVMKPRKVPSATLAEGVDASTLETDDVKRAPKQLAALTVLLNQAQGEKQKQSWALNVLAREHGVEPTTARALAKKGLVTMGTVEQLRDPTKLLPAHDAKRVVHTPEQRVAVATINTALQAAAATDSSVPRTVLLQGVTASGKTEVYLAAIEECLKLGRRALVLVPEIALTAQTVEIFQRRFQERVAILHSALGSGERFDEWRRARAGRADIVVGARSAVFAPCRDIGLIIIDEEHDHSYKQDSTPRYHARDVAHRRAALDNAVVVLGSATPSLESYHKAIKGEYTHAIMTQRIGISRLPQVDLVDMTKEARMGELPALSRRLQDELCASVSRGEQVILFLNRRGFATYVQCVACGHAQECPNCDVSLTYHRGLQLLRCHHCGYDEPVPEACPACKGWMMSFTGTGTEKVEGEVATLLQRRGLEHIKILRLDRDTTTRKGSHGRILGEFRQGQAQVLIGTQMVTKGLDFPRVTLVGVISADGSLNMPDFRAAERTFQLLSQVAGRAGRGDKPGLVLMQALSTDHYAIEAACHHSFEEFVALEMESRKNPAYPPFAHVVNVISQDESQGQAKVRLDSLAIKLNERIAAEGGGTELLGPVDCVLARVKSKFRFHLMLRDRNKPRLHRVLSVYDELSRQEKEGLTVDVDAMSIL